MENQCWLKSFRREVMYGSFGAVRKIINKKPATVDIDAPIMSGRTESVLEYLACKTNASKRDGKIIKMLVQHGANPLKKDKMEYPILTYSFQTFDSDVILELLRHLEDIDTPLDPLRNALHLSAFHGKLSVMRYCLQKKADPNRTFHLGITPLYMALSSPRHRVNMIKLLTANGADVNQKMHDGLTILHCALAHKDNEELVKSILMRKPDMNVLDSNCLTPLYFLLVNGYYNFGILESLLEHGSDPDIPGLMGGNALHILASVSKMRYRTAKVSSILIKYGASVNHKDQYGNTPLHCAVFEGVPALVENLIDNGVDVTLKNQHGLTALQLVNVTDTLIGVAYIPHILMKQVMLKIHSEQFKPSADLNEFIDSSESLARMKREFLKELLQLENDRLGETSLSFLKILTSNDREIAAYARNEETMMALKKARLTGYKHYGKQLRKKINAAIRRYRLERYSEDIVNTFAETTVPTTCMQLIVDNLINRDIEERLKKVHSAKKRGQCDFSQLNTKRVKK